MTSLKYSEEQLIQSLFELRDRNKIITQRNVRDSPNTPCAKLFRNRLSGTKSTADKLDMPNGNWCGETPESLKWKLRFIGRNTEGTLTAEDVSNIDDLPSMRFISKKLGGGSWVDAKREAGLNPSTTKNRPKKSVECSRCKQTFDLGYSRAERQDLYYCSHECYTYREVVECDSCGSEVRKKPSYVNDHNFCDNDCAVKWRSENLSGESHYRYKDREQIKCDWCGDTLERLRSNINDNNFCGTECRDKWFSENRSGSSNPDWKGGKSSWRGSGWSQVRRNIRKRDNHKCQNCGVKEENYQHELDVHHKIPFHEFEDAEEANRASNLVSLCRHCHSNVENGNIELD